MSTIQAKRVDLIKLMNEVSARIKDLEKELDEIRSFKFQDLKWDGLRIWHIPSDKRLMETSFQTRVDCLKQLPAFRLHAMEQIDLQIIQIEAALKSSNTTILKRKAKE